MRLTGNISRSQSGPGSNGNEELLHCIPGATSAAV